MQKPRVAAVGCGRWGKNIIRNLSRLGTLAAVVDKDYERARDLGKHYGVPTFEDLGQLIEARLAEAIAIASPSETHARLSTLALEANLDVFVEKPMATRMQDGENMLRIATERGRILMVGHLLEYHGAVLKAKELIEQGKLGRIEYIYANRLNRGRVKQEENALWSFAPHDVAVILLLVGEPLIQVTATGGSYAQPNIADVTLTNLLFHGGLRGHIFVSWLHAFKEQKLVITGTKGMLVFDDVVPDDKLVFFDRSFDNVEGELVARNSSGTAIEFERSEPLMTELRHFIDCLSHRRQPKTDGRNGMRVLSVLQASRRSIHVNGEPIDLQPNFPRDHLSITTTTENRSSPG